MKFWKHITGQPFIFATGLAALIHSTWSLGTLFAGTEPTQFTLEWVGWLIPALLIAFALDVGQIVTSEEIRSGNRSRSKYATFLVFAVATYYLQWIYIAHHMPVVALGVGVRASWGDAAGLIRDSAIWFIPALLPLSTALYTFSYGKTAKPVSNSTESVPVELFKTPDPLPDTLPAAPEMIPIAAHVEQQETEPEPVKHVYSCPDCGYTKQYETEYGMIQAQRVHKSRFCVPIKELAINGDNT